MVANIYHTIQGFRLFGASPRWPVLIPMPSGYSLSSKREGLLCSTSASLATLQTLLKTFYSLFIDEDVE